MTLKKKCVRVLLLALIVAVLCVVPAFASSSALERAREANSLYLLFIKSHLHSSVWQRYPSLRSFALSVFRVFTIGSPV